MNTSVVTRSEEETSAAGEELAARIRPGDVVLLHGELGAGKTAFVRGLARGLGASPEDVSSPTFTLIQEYRGRLTLYHVDLYRLDPWRSADLGLDEMVDGNGVVAIEWAERWRRRARATRVVRIAHEGDDERRIEIDGCPRSDGSRQVPTPHSTR